MSSAFRFWLGWALVLALSLVLVVWGLLHWNHTFYSRLVSDRLLLLAELRRGAVEQYFSTAKAELRFWSTNQELVEAAAELVELWEGGDTALQVRRSYIEDNPSPVGFYLNLDDAGDGSAYSEFHARMHPRARLFVTARGYYDFFLIAPDGDVMYSVEKEADFTTNLLQGEWRDTALADVFRRARKLRAGAGVVLSDLQSYAPSEGQPAMFMATALNSEAGEFLGVIAFQLPTDRILGIMNYTSGMGETGETYLVGSDRLMRSDSRFSEETTVLRQTVETPSVERALAGEQGVHYITDYRGIEVLSVYLPMMVDQVPWAVVAEIDREEVGRIAAAERPALSGILALFYGLSLWSVWYWRNRSILSGDDSGQGALDFPESGGGGMDG